MRRITRGAKVVAAVGVLTLAVAVPSGSAQAPGPTTLTFFEPDAGSTFKILDNAPKSPVRNPESKRYRFSIGDKLTFSSPLFDRKGGTRLGTLHVDATIVKGRTFNNISALATGSYVLNDGSQIAVQGVFKLSTKVVTIPVVGGSGRFEGARGHLTSTSAPTSSTDVLTLTLP
jgi:hypothetical protein